VVLCFDSDDAGQNAAVRSLDSLLASGLAIRVAVVPSPHDPDSFIKESGGAAFRELIEQADGFFDYYLNRLCLQNDLGTDKGRLTVLQDMAQAVHKTGNVVLIDTYAQKTALRLGVSAEAVRAEFRKASRLKGATPSPEVEETVAPAPELVRPATTEYWLLKLILMHEETVEWLRAHLDLNWIQHAVVRQIISQRFDAQADGSWQGVAAFLTLCDAAEMRSLITEATAEDRPIHNSTQQSNDIVLRLRNQFVDRQITLLTQRSGQPEFDEAERLDMLRQQQELRALKRQPLTPLPGSSEEPF
jgi:DNA primase